MQPGTITDRRHCVQADDSHNIVTLMSGDYYVSSNPGDMLVTILGSCVSACIRDPVACVGGMNHFLLPGDEAMRDAAKGVNAMRYGVHAMEKLIDGVLTAGGRMERLEIKVFGGGNVINNSQRIGSLNAAFVQRFLNRQGLSIHSQDLEGELPRRIHYFPHTGKAMIRKLRRKDDFKIAEQEAQYRESLIPRMQRNAGPYQEMTL